MLIFSVIMATLIPQSKTTCWHGLMRKVGKSCKNIFVMISKWKISSQQQYEKYVHMFKTKEIKPMRVLIYPRITNTHFPHHIFMKNLYLMCQILKKGQKNELEYGTRKRRWVIITTIWTRNNNYLKKEQNNFIGKQDSIDLYDEGKSNNSQYHTPRYDGGMLGNSLIPRCHIPSCDGGLCKRWTWG